MTHENVLIVEDDPAMLRGLKDNFEYEGYTVRTASEGKAGLEAALDGKPDLIVLDIMLPELNGYEICRLLREEGLDMPIIMLTAKGQEVDIVLGLNLGADDYVVKPFSIKELLARANAFLRKQRRTDSQHYLFGNMEFAPDAQKLWRDGKEVLLTPKESGLLALLTKRPGRTFTRDEILSKVWGYSSFVTSRSVDRCITTLRAKIEPDPNHPVFIKTVREIGYRFEPSETS